MSFKQKAFLILFNDLKIILTFKFFLLVLKISVSCFLVRNEISSKNSKQIRIFLKKLLIKTLSCLWHLLTLSTNIPLDETIDICVDMVCNKRRNVKVMLKCHFKQLLMLLVKSSFSFFNGVYYKQIDSVAMGSPLGPTLANIFLTYCEDSWLDNCPIQFRPRYYRSYYRTVYLNGELHKSEVLLIASTLLVVKTENIYRNTTEMHINHKNHKYKNHR